MLYNVKPAKPFWNILVLVLCAETGTAMFYRVYDLESAQKRQHDSITSRAQLSIIMFHPLELKHQPDGLAQILHKITRKEGLLLLLQPTSRAQSTCFGLIFWLHVISFYTQQWDELHCTSRSKKENEGNKYIHIYKESKRWREIERDMWSHDQFRFTENSLSRLYFFTH